MFGASSLCPPCAACAPCLPIGVAAFVWLMVGFFFSSFFKSPLLSAYSLVLSLCTPNVRVLIQAAVFGLYMTYRTLTNTLKFKLKSQLLTLRQTYGWLLGGKPPTPPTPPRSIDIPKSGVHMKPPTAYGSAWGSVSRAAAPAAAAPAPSQGQSGSGKGSTAASGASSNPISQGITKAAASKRRAMVVLDDCLGPREDVDEAVEEYLNGRGKDCDQRWNDAYLATAFTNRVSRLDRKGVDDANDVYDLRTAFTNGVASDGMSSVD